ncbi:hypothetical protein L1049_010355 [Liquidambar formosana]|uniref:Uncharacterized protein n=1 Tax=Liquidambar formosana TaxID=63359 RepID=A0AAP0N7E9_LIQFO
MGRTSKAGAAARIPVSRLNLMCYSHECECSGEPTGSLSDMVFGFIEDGEASPENFGHENEALDEDEEGENSGTVEENKTFWESQHKLLEETLYRSSSLESRIRNATKEALKETKMAETVCVCQRPVDGGCRNCLMREVSGRLRNAGYNSAICKTKWRKSPDIPSGEHTFLDVVDNSSSKKGEVRVIIELNFRAEFEMARASEEYNTLIGRLPELFVGRVDRLNNIIKILCAAAKKCMKDKKMHMGPWRKQRYMEAKWLSTCERTTPTPVLSMGYSGRRSKPRASMLTVDLLEKLPNMHRTVLQVV